MSAPTTAPAPGAFVEQFEAASREDQINLVLMYMERGLLPQLADELRAHNHGAVFETPLGFLASRFGDVMEGFDRNEVFSVAPYGDRMVDITGAFMLGMDPGPRYDHASAVVHLACPGIGQPALGRWIEKYAKQAVEAAAREGTFDVVQEVAYAIPLGFVGHYFGVPGPNAAAYTRWVQAAVLYIFNSWTDADVFRGSIKTTASQGGVHFAAYLDRVIQDRLDLLKSGQPAPDDVLTRLLRMWLADPATSFDPVGIRRNLAGLILGSTVAPMGMLVAAIATLLRLQVTAPKAFAMTRQAALDGDDALLRQCMLEVARLGPPSPPTMFRVANQDYVIAKGTPRETLIPEGSRLVLLLSSAMMDPEFVDQPHDFRPGRPDWNYVMFGQGQHECLGRGVGISMLTYTAKALLKLPGLRPAPGATLEFGTGVTEKYFPIRWELEWDGP